MIHIQDHFEGSSIDVWERQHNIARYIRGGCEYVVCRDWNGFNAKLEEERQRARREYVAQEQARAYFGKV